MEKYAERNIPKEHKDKFNKCKICGSEPIIETINNWYDCYSVIRCPNENCENGTVKWNKGIFIYEVAKDWNKMNPKNPFIPSSDIHEIIENCFNCKHKDNCIKALGLENELLKTHICDNYEKRS